VAAPDLLELEAHSAVGATQGVFQNIPYWSFPAAATQAYRSHINIPISLSIPTPFLHLCFHVIGLLAGILPQLVITARRVPRPGGATDPANLPLTISEFNVVCATVATLSAGNQYVEFVSNSFVVLPGDTVFFSVERLSSDLYAGEVGILRQFGLVVSGALS
jgi:hypothetical protein